MNRSTIFIILLIAQFSLFSMALIKKHKSSLTIYTPPSSLLSTDPGLEDDGELMSPNGLYSLALKSKGVLRLNSITKTNGGTQFKQIWSSDDGKGRSKGGHTLKMQPDGNLVIYNIYGQGVWSTGTFGKGNGPYKVTMQDDGNVVLYDSTNMVLWSTGTFGQK